MSSEQLVATKQKDIKRNEDGTFVPGVTPEGSIPFLPGVSGNPAGRPKNSVTTLLKNRSPEDNKKIADKLYQMAINGDMAAIREYIDRTDGRVTGDLPAFNDNRQLTINVVGTEGKKLLEEIAKGIKPHKEIGSG